MNIDLNKNELYFIRDSLKHDIDALYRTRDEIIDNDLRKMIVANIILHENLHKRIIKMIWDYKEDQKRIKRGS